MKIIKKKFDELTGKEVYKIGKIRGEVFVVEQNCPYLDFDDKDYNSIHLYYLDDNDEIVSYCRILGKNVSYPEISIGRVLTNKNYRGKGYSRKLLEEAIKIIKEEIKEKSIRISAQNYLKEFYKSLGFVEISDIYLEDNIPHIEMKLEII